MKKRDKQEEAKAALQRELDMHLKNATRADAPPVEAAYYNRMAVNTKARIDSMQPRKKYDRSRRYEEDES